MSGGRPGLPWDLLVAHDDQMFGSRIVRVEGGSGDGSRLLEVWTPSGLHVEFVLDRGFDVHTVRFRGQPISWLGPPGLRGRQEYEPAGFGWLRTFHGGLVVTCGLDHFGSPVTRDAAEYAPPDSRQVHHGEHGRVSHQSASLDRCEVDLDGDPAIRIVGHVIQASLYGEQYSLRREYCLSLLRPEVSLTDTVTNVGPLPTRQVLLYHFNFGYPLVDTDTTLSLRTTGGTLAERFGACAPSAPERVDSYNLAPDPNGRARAVIENSANGIRAELTYDMDTLPAFLVWKLPRTRANVLGLAPASHLSPEEAQPLVAGGQRTYRWVLALAAVATEA